MDFELTTDQEALQHAVRRLCEGRFPIERVRRLADAPGCVDRGLWSELAGAGVFNLRVPEALGGVGLATADAVLVFEELGRALVPGPLLGTHLAADLAPGAWAADAIVGIVQRSDAPVLVEHFDALDVVVALDADGVRRLDPRALDATAVPDPLDPLTPLHRVGALPRGERVAGPDVAEAWRLAGTTLAAALALGIAEATTDLAVAYAKQREQFDRPIGSFQAVKHLLADMLVRAEVARAAVYAAGVVLDQPDTGDPARAAAAAKIGAGEAAILNAKACIQVHGGMGFTWEVPAHLYLKRAWWLDTILGSADAHAEAIAALL